MRIHLLKWLLFVVVGALGVSSGADGKSGEVASVQVGDWVCPTAEGWKAGDRNAFVSVKLPEVLDLAPAKGAVVRLRLVFRDLNGTPAVNVIYNSATQAQAEAMTAAASDYRLSCWHGLEPPMALIQEVHFTPGGAVASPMFPAIVGGDTKANCVSRGSFEPPMRRVDMSDRVGTGRSDKQARSGAVAVKLRFDARDQPPSVTVIGSTAGAEVEKVALDHVERYRWLCAGEPATKLEFSQVFKAYQDDARLTFAQFLSTVDERHLNGQRLDFTSMGCPFQADLTYLQPYMPNQASEAIAGDNHRRAFFNWLQTLTLKSELAARDRQFGRTFTFVVPCAVLDLR